MSRSQAFDAVQQLRADLFGESKIDPGLLVRMSDRLNSLEEGQKKLRRNPMVVVGNNLHYVGGLLAMLLMIFGGPVLGTWVKATLHLK